MNILALSTAMSQDNVREQASVSLLKSSMDMMKTTGADMVKLIASGSVPSSTVNPDGVGTNVDLYA
ncbi:MAG: YjfB family protein [Treponema sp.]|nr:YjfB family protein [Treponema sp.]